MGNKEEKIFCPLHYIRAFSLFSEVFEFFFLSGGGAILLLKLAH